MNRFPRQAKKPLNYRILNSTGERALRDVQIPSDQNTEEQSIDCPSVSSVTSREESLAHSLELSAVLPFHDHS